MTLILLLLIILFLFLKYKIHEKFDSITKKGTVIIPNIYKHSKNPNTSITKFKDSYYLVANKDIIDNKITVDYNSSLKNINKLKINKSNIHGFGLFLKNDFDKNSVLFRAIFNKNITYLSRFVNHSFNPNLYLLKINADYYFVTKQKLYKDDELTINYDLTPSYIKDAKACGTTH